MTSPTRNLRRVFGNERMAHVWADYCFEVYGIVLGIRLGFDSEGEYWTVG